MTRSIRVLHLLVTTSPGGGPKHVHDLARHLPGEFEALVAAPRDGIFFDRFRELGLTTVELPLSRLGVWPVQLAIRLIKRHAVDIVHTHGKGPGLYGRIAATALGVPAVHTLHGIHYGGYSRAGRGLYLGLERQLSRMSRVIINVSASQETEGLGLGLFATRQSAVVVNGVDLDETDAAAPRLGHPARDAGDRRRRLRDRQRQPVGSRQALRDPPAGGAASSPAGCPG